MDSQTKTSPVEANPVKNDGAPPASGQASPASNGVKKLLIISLAAVGVIAGTMAVSASQRGNFNFKGFMGLRKGPGVETLAEKLGISEEDLRARLDNGEKLCDIAGEFGIDRPCPNFENRPEFPGKPNLVQQIKQWAEKLGISEEYLRVRLDNGEKLCDIAEELGAEMPCPGLGKHFGFAERPRLENWTEKPGFNMEEIQAKRQEMTQKMIDEGKITEEQLAKRQEMTEKMKEKFANGFFRNSRRGWRPQQNELPNEE